jgi:tetratricopeptide (TPR) repeat protein
MEYIQYMEDIIKLLSENITGIFILIGLFILKKPISVLIERLTKITYKTSKDGTSQLDVQAGLPEVHQKHIPNQENKPSLEQKNNKELKLTSENAKNKDWFTELHKAFIESRIDDAKLIFSEYEKTENNPVELEKNKSTYLYLLFTKGNDNFALGELNKLIESSSNEESKYTALVFLSFCYQDGRQIKLDIELWEKYIKTFTNSSLITESTIQLAQALFRDDNFIQAKHILITLLNKTAELNFKSDIFNTLSKIEKGLGNKNLAVYCKDKSQELKPNDRDGLFNTAYEASEENIDPLSISNYSVLLNIDPDNSTAFNNLGVKAQEAELKTKAVENYKKSSDKSNSLALANLGYLLLDSGFVDDAQQLADKALDMDDTHENIYSLLADIDKTKKDEDKKWNVLVKKCFEHQKFIRNYTQAYYEGEDYFNKGEWKTLDDSIVNLTVENGNLVAKWQNQLGVLDSGSIININLTGELIRSAFKGRYTEANEENKNGGLMNYYEKNINCIGVLSENGTLLTIIAEDYSENFLIKLKASNN